MISKSVRNSCALSIQLVETVNWTWDISISLGDSDSDTILDVEGLGDGEVDVVAFFLTFARFLNWFWDLFTFSCTLQLGIHLRGAFDAWRVWMAFFEPFKRLLSKAEAWSTKSSFYDEEDQSFERDCIVCAALKETAMTTYLYCVLQASEPVLFFLFFALSQSLVSPIN